MIGIANGLLSTDLIFRLLLDILIDSYSSVDECFLGQHHFEYFLTIVQINSMQVLSLGLFLSNNVDSIEHAKLGDVIEYLASVVFLVLHWIEAEVKLGEQTETLNILELKHLDDVVQSKVQEAKTINVMQSSEESNMIF